MFWDLKHNKRIIKGKVCLKHKKESQKIIEAELAPNLEKG